MQFPPVSASSYKERQELRAQRTREAVAAGADPQYVGMLWNAWSAFSSYGEYGADDLLLGIHNDVKEGGVSWSIKHGGALKALRGLMGLE